MHEHFISNLIVQKIQSNIERNQATKFRDNDKIFVLFLPRNEIHELGLLYFHYELTLRGYHSIYLGQNIPVNAVKDIKLLYPNVQFVSYFTVEPHENDIEEYLSKIHNKLLKNTNNTFWFLGRRAAEYNRDIPYPEIEAISCIKDALKII